MQPLRLEKQNLQIKKKTSCEDRRILAAFFGVRNSFVALKFHFEGSLDNFTLVAFRAVHHFSHSSLKKNNKLAISIVLDHF